MFDANVGTVFAHSCVDGSVAVPGCKIKWQNAGAPKVLQMTNQRNESKAQHQNSLPGHLLLATYSTP